MLKHPKIKISEKFTYQILHKQKKEHRTSPQTDLTKLETKKWILHYFF